MKKIAIIGAGWLGLSVAEALIQKMNSKENQIEITILDRDYKIGGVLAGEPFLDNLDLAKGQASNENTDYYEMSAQALFASQDLEKLMKSLVGEVVYPESRILRRRYLYDPAQSDCLKKPLGFKDALVFAKIKILSRFYRPQQNEKLLDWGDRVLGRRINRDFFLVALQGVFGGGTADLSARLVFENMFQSTKGGKKSLLPKCGLKDFIKKWAESLEKRGVKVQMMSEVKESELERMPFDKVFVCAPVTREVLGLNYQSLGKIIFKKSKEDVLSKDCFGILFNKDVIEKQLTSSQLDMKLNILRPLGVTFDSSLYSHIFKRSQPDYLESWIFEYNPKLIDNMSDYGEFVLNFRKKIFKGNEKVETYPFSRVSFWSKAFPKYDIYCEKLLETQRRINFKRSEKVFDLYLANGNIGLGSKFDWAQKFIKNMSI